MDVVADLHVHTTASDGRLTLSELPTAARRRGVDVVAVTDHDRLHPGLDAPVTALDGVTVIRGVELQVETESGRVDLLAYGVEKTPALRTELDRIQTDRVERARHMAARIEARLGVDLDAIERYYPYDRPVDGARLDGVIERHDLLATGGSDAHDRRLGVAGLSATEYARIASRLPDAQA